MRVLRLGGAVLVVAGIATATQSRADAARTVLPIRLNVVAKEDDKQVYSIPVELGKVSLEAVLDTGSVPTLVLPNRIKPSAVTPTGATFSIIYGGSRKYTGDVVDGPIRLRGTSGSVEFGIVKTAECLPAYPQCPIAGEPPQRARFGGNLFPAIIGAQLKVGAGQLKNVFGDLGVDSYLINAPTAGAEGQLILNPTANETSTFVPITASPATDVDAGSVNGCIKDTATSQTLCGAIFFDTGQTGVFVYPQKQTQVFIASPTDPIQLVLTDGSGNEVAGVDFTASRTGATHMTTIYPPGTSSSPYSVPFIRIGQIPYLGLKVVTDLRHGGYVVAVRPARHGQPVGHIP